VLLIKKEGPEGLGRKNFKIETQSNQSVDPMGLLADIYSLKRFRFNRHLAN
jgi:hypothetical protein